MGNTERGHITLSGFLTGAAVGAVVGAGVALLLAPKSGKDTREWLGAKSTQMKGRLAEAVERTKAAVRHEAQAIANTLDTPKH
jgi:gas vesicle protein